VVGFSVCQRLSVLRTTVQFYTLISALKSLAAFSLFRLGGFISSVRNPPERFPYLDHDRVSLFFPHVLLPQCWTATTCFYLPSNPVRFLPTTPVRRLGRLVSRRQAFFQSSLLSPWSDPSGRAPFVLFTFFPLLSQAILFLEIKITTV